VYPSLGRFEPRFETLTAAQRSLWPKLVDLPPDVVLYGGTALAPAILPEASTSS
jgi:hypothetical protein